MAVVSIEGLSKQYATGGEFAVRGVTLTVSDGEFIVLLGPSGCGKSSILRMIAGLEPITSGTVSIDGRVMNMVPAKDRDIAMVFQSYALYPHMSVRDNLAFGLRRRNVSPSDVARRVNDVAGRLGLLPFLTRKPHALSGGQRQRVALGRAIIRQPKVFLFDEPLSNLDAGLRVSTRGEISRQQREIGTTTIYVTHDQAEAMTIAHRICIMNAGEVVQIGTPMDVYRNPAGTFVARFLGNPPMNLLPAVLQPAGGHARVTVAGVTFELPRWPVGALQAHLNREVTFGVRPEDLYEVPNQDQSHPVPRLRVQVRGIEPLGAETILLLGAGDQDHELVARVGRETSFKIGEQREIVVDVAGVHLFDAASGKTIPRPSG
jgi:multiple sugar transport system ATP-binding protein